MGREEEAGSGETELGRGDGSERGLGRGGQGSSEKPSTSHIVDVLMGCLEFLISRALNDRPGG